MSPFVGHELLYDYVAEVLDSERRHSLEKLVNDSAELKNDIQKIKNGLAYCQQMSQVEVSDSVIESIRKPSTYFQVLLQKMRINEWPAGIRLSVEIVIVAALVITSSLLIPWHKVANLQMSNVKEIVLTEVSRESTSKKASDTVVKIEEKPLYQDEGSTAVTIAAAPPTTIVVATKRVPEPKQKAKTPMTVAVIAAAPAVEAQTESEEAPSGASQGSLYRGNISVANLPVTTTKFVEKITEIGGRKAGEVPLGWKKGSGTYFHFTIPEKQLEALQKFMGAYGSLKIQKEKHPRLMPEGIVRIIITVEERK